MSLLRRNDGAVRRIWIVLAALTAIVALVVGSVGTATWYYDKTHQAAPAPTPVADTAVFYEITADGQSPLAVTRATFVWMAGGKLSVTSNRPYRSSAELSGPSTFQINVALQGGQTVTKAMICDDFNCTTPAPVTVDQWRDFADGVTPVCGDVHANACAHIQAPAGSTLVVLFDSLSPYGEVTRSSVTQASGTRPRQTIHWAECPRPYST